MYADLWIVNEVGFELVLGEAPRRHVVQPNAVPEVAYGVLDLGLAAMISLQFQCIPIAVGDEGVIAVSGEEGQLGTGRGLHSPDDEPHRCGVGLGMERSVEPVSAPAEDCTRFVCNVSQGDFGRNVLPNWRERCCVHSVICMRLLLRVFMESSVRAVD